METEVKTEVLCAAPLVKCKSSRKRNVLQIRKGLKKVGIRVITNNLLVSYIKVISSNIRKCFITQDSRTWENLSTPVYVCRWHRLRKEKQQEGCHRKGTRVPRSKYYLIKCLGDTFLKPRQNLQSSRNFWILSPISANSFFKSATCFAHSFFTSATCFSWSSFKAATCFSWSSFKAATCFR